MKVLHVSTTISRGGAENHLVELIEGLIAADQELEMRCAYLKGHPYWAARFAELGVATSDLGMAFNGAPMPIFRLRRLIREFTPDIVHAHGTHAEFYTFAALRFLPHRPRLVVSRHEERLRFFKKPGFRLFDNAITDAAQGFIAISEAVRNLDVQRQPRLAGKMRVIHYGFTPPAPRTEEAQEIRRDWCPEERGTLITTLARFVPEKSLDTLIRAVAILKTRSDRPFVVALVGRGPLEATLRKLANDLGVERLIVWPGFREDVPEILAATDVFTLPSRCEGFGLVLLEAMAASLPIVASRVSAIPEIVREGETGFLFEAGNVEELADRLQRLIEDEALRGQFGRAGKARLVTDFSPHKMVRQTMEFYRDMAA